MGGVSMVTVSADDGEVRLDRWFRRHYPQVTQGMIQKLLRTKPETYRLFLRVLNALWQSMLEAAGLQEREEINK